MSSMVDEALAAARSEIAFVPYSRAGDDVYERLRGAYIALRLAFCRLDGRLSAGELPPAAWRAEQPYRRPVTEGVARHRAAFIALVASAARFTPQTSAPAVDFMAERIADELMALVNAILAARTEGSAPLDGSRAALEEMTEALRRARCGCESADCTVHGAYDPGMLDRVGERLAARAKACKHPLERRGPRVCNDCFTPVGQIEPR